MRRILKFLITYIREKSGYYNTNLYQRKWTKIAIHQNEHHNEYSWGKPIESESVLGDYNEIKNMMLIPY